MKTDNSYTQPLLTMAANEMDVFAVSMMMYRLILRPQTVK